MRLWKKCLDCNILGIGRKAYSTTRGVGIKLGYARIDVASDFIRQTLELRLCLVIIESVNRKGLLANIVKADIIMLEVIINIL